MKKFKFIMMFLVIAILISNYSFVYAKEKMVDENMLLDQCVEYMATAQECITDEDCAVYFSRGCVPCDCYTPYNKNADLSAIDKIREQLSEYIVCETCVTEDLESVCEEDQCVLKIVESEENEEDLVVCPADAKLCPDGSYVGRTGPECKFKLCPNEG